MRARRRGSSNWQRLRSAADIVSSIATAVGSVATDDVCSLARYLGERSGLLVIDNCEHVLDVVAEVIDTISLSCPGVVIVTTSREFLALEGEQVFDGQAARSDGRRIRSAAGPCSSGGSRDRRRTTARWRKPFASDSTGLPLAIEIAATRAGTLGLRELRSSLEDRFTLLAAGQRRGVERQQTMGKAIDWSYQLLSPDEQRLFRMLGIFPGGFELDAAADVALGWDTPATRYRCSSRRWSPEA